MFTTVTATETASVPALSSSALGAPETAKAGSYPHYTDQKREAPELCAGEFLHVSPFPF